VVALSRLTSRLESMSLSTSAPEPIKRVKEDPKLVPIIPLETSLKYMKSQAYKDAYGDAPVWVPYRRNFKGQFPPVQTRRSCIKQGYMHTGNPCPICRDEYLVIDPYNVDLLKQFVSPFNGEILGTKKTNLCRRRYFELLVAFEKAKDLGTISFDVPFRKYDYSDYKDFFSS